MAVLKLKEIKKIIDQRGNKKVVFVSGVFDLFHFGHYHALKKASQLGEIFIVQIDGNKLVKKRKGQDRPYFDQRKRASIIASLKFVNLVYITNKPSESEEILQIIKPDIYIRAVINSESDSDRKAREKNILKKTTGTKIMWIKQTPEISTTKIVNLLKGQSKNTTINNTI